jgi:hypothetical protein
MEGTGSLGALPAAPLHTAFSPSATEGNLRSVGGAAEASRQDDRGQQVLLRARPSGALLQGARAHVLPADPLDDSVAVTMRNGSTGGGAWATTTSLHGYSSLPSYYRIAPVKPSVPARRARLYFLD